MIRSILLISFLSPILLLGQESTFEKSEGLQSSTYEDAIEFYRELESNSPYARLIEEGPTDIGKPLHLFVMSRNGIFEPSEESTDRNVVLLINNGIHAGEPCGIDASMMFARELLNAEAEKLPENVIVCIVPVYNIDGALNRGSYSRANQIGPESYGFRGNARNLDLNRDFIKCDSRNTRSLIGIFQKWKPHFFIDTHTTDGADYKATMTLIPTQKNKIDPGLAEYMESEMNPYLYERMNAGKFHTCPYVNYNGDSPEQGIIGFLETGRYSSGYTSLFNCMSYISEAHMLKPFADRVQATYELLYLMLEKINADAEIIIDMKKEADKSTSLMKTFAINWELDTTSYDNILFEGYEAEKIISEVTGLERTNYNRQKPFVKEIRFFNDYRPLNETALPYAYIIPQAWREVISRLEWNGVEMQQMEKDMRLYVNAYYIDDYQSLSWPYEGHHLNYAVEKSTKRQEIQFYKGDVVIKCDQTANRFLSAVLEPDAPDSYFCWNFFDEVLMQKEYFSGFVFDETAAQLLEEDNELRKEFQLKKSRDPEFSKDHRAQLDWIYKRSPFYEVSHLRYPVFRIETEEDLQ